MGLRTGLLGMQTAALLVSIVLLSQTSGQEQLPTPEFEAKVHEDVKEQAAAAEEKIEVIVQTSGGDEASQREVLESIGDITHDYSTIPSFSLEVSPERIEELAQAEFVESIDPDPVFRAQLQQSVPLINASKAWKHVLSGLNLTGNGVGICIIDTGVDYTHPDLGGCSPTSNINTAGCYRVVGGYDFVNGDSDPMDDNGHGTHVSGIAAANGGIFGAAPDADIVAIKSLNSAGGGTLSNIVAGIDWCVSNATSFKIGVISMSLGDESVYSTYCDGTYPSMTASIDAAVGRNITVVVASGNDGSTSGISNPACVRNATAVGSTTDGDVVSSFSNRNSLIDFMAPGSSINSTRRQGGYVEADGTSMATPHAAGMFAILYQKYKAVFNQTPNVTYLENISKTYGKSIFDSGTGLSFPRLSVLNASDQIGTRRLLLSNNMSSGLVERGSQAQLSALWSDDVSLHSAVLSTNETGAFRNYTGGTHSSPIYFDSNFGWSNFTWSNGSLPNGTLVVWRAYANDSFGSANSTATMNFTVVDTSVYITNLTHPSGIVYSPTAVYTFNATVTDFTGVGSVTLEWNSSENVTAQLQQTVNSTSSTYGANRTGLAFGNYTYRWIANDTLGNINSVAASATGVVSKAPTSVGIFLNGTQSNFTYDRSSSVNITASLNVSSIGGVSIFLNSSGSTAEVNSSSDSTSYFLSTSSLFVGSYNVTALYNGSNSSYSQSSSTLFFFVRESYRNSSVSIAANVLEVLNASQANMTLDFLTNDTIVNNETNVTIGTDNPVGELPSGVPLGKFIRINVSQSIASNLTYSVIRYRYLDSELPSGIDEGTLRVFRWNGSAWVRFDGQFVGGVDADQNTVFANTTQFSDFTISGELASAPEPAPQPSSGGGGGGGSSARKNATSVKQNTTSVPIDAPAIAKPEENKTEPPEPVAEPAGEEPAYRQVTKYDYVAMSVAALTTLAAVGGIFYLRHANPRRRHRRRMKGEIEVTPSPS